ncbi:MAG: competence protein ComEC family protein, partial [Defluviitaleaceae bacterium]|nr:competence protein ComEC family protein [Defluviitaleaceae bacterium]
MKRPIVWVLGFLITGIVIGQAPAMLALNPILLFGLSLVLGLLFCGFLYRVYKYKAVFAFALFLLIGLVRVASSIHSHITQPVYVEFYGVVLDIGRTSGGNQRAVIQGSISGFFVETDDYTALQHTNPESNHSFRIMAYIRPHQPQAALGQEVIIRGYLQPLRGPQNPGGYNQFQHLRSQKIDAYIWPEAIVLGEVQTSVIVLLRRFRDRLSNVYDSILPPREAGVIKSMVLGDRLDMDQSLAAQYRMMGIFHILSISGMHVAILTMAAFSVLKLVMPERKAGVVVLVIMIAYCLMTGAAVPTVRAVTMGGILVFGRILLRDYDLLASVSLAGIALLIYEPLYLFNVGFQLSFCAVFGIGILKAPIERGLTLLRFPSGSFRGSLAVGIAAVVASYMVFAYHLYEIPLYSVIGNLVIMPTVTVLLILGALIGLVGLVWLTGAEVLAGPVYFILRFYEIASSFFAALPGSMALVGGGSLVVAGAGVAVILTFAFAFSGFGDDFDKRLGLFFCAVLVLISCVYVRDFPRDLRVTVLQAHGHYSVLRHRNDVFVIGSGRGGEAALLGYMDMRGINRANGMVLTAPPRPADITR